MSEQKYTTSEILENLSHVKAITNSKTEYSKQTSVYFIIWGLIWIIAYTILLLEFSSFTIGLYWSILGAAGWVITVITYLKQEKVNPMPLFLRAQFKYAWLAIIMFIVIFVFLIYSGLLLYRIDYLSFYSVLLVSIMYILLGIVLTKEIFMMGFWLSILGMITFSLFPNFMNIIFAVIGGGSLLLTGFILKRKGQGNE